MIDHWQPKEQSIIKTGQPREPSRFDIRRITDPIDNWVLQLVDVFDFM